MKDDPIELKAQIQLLRQRIQEQKFIINDYHNKLERQSRILEKDIEYQKQLETVRIRKKEKIGELLVSKGFITQDVLNKALQHKAQFGGNITQYLLAYGHITDLQLAKCLCEQFSMPYLPLTAYTISEKVIKLIPPDIAVRFLVVPVDRQGDTLMLVMVDPLDTTAINLIQKLTGCRVVSCVGILSEIIEALEHYYNVPIDSSNIKSKKQAPFFINTPTYQGIERRYSIRFPCNIDISFSIQNSYQKSKTIDVSRDGLLFIANGCVPLGAILPIEINLPLEVSPLPIMALTQVVRIEALEKGKYRIAVRMVKISRDELDTIIEYASRKEAPKKE